MANSLDAFIPELWANESLLILEENMVAAGLVHRNFEDQIANFGDIVNTRKPAEFIAKRKVDGDDVTDQDAQATNVAVPLDQFIHVSYVIRDGEESKSFKNLVNEYMRPAALAMARMIDQVVLGQVYGFLANSAGSLGGLTPDNAQDYILDAREVMNRNKAWMDNRNMIVTPDSETEILKTELFISAEKVGDQGTALREASLGRKLGWNFYMCQNMSEVPAGNTTTVTNTVNGAHSAGATTIALGGTGTILVGDVITIAGDSTPQVVTSTTGGPPPTSMTISPGLQSDVLTAAVVTKYTPGTTGAAYAAGYSKYLTIAGFTVAPKVGQMVTIGVDPAQVVAAKYSVLDATTTTLLLDRPLEYAVSNGGAVHLGAAGSYNFGFHKNAMALVIRPLATPMAGTGALSARASYKNVGMRTTITYDGKAQGHRVTHDLLAGIKILDTDLGVVMLG